MMMNPVADELARDRELDDALGPVSDYPQLDYSMHDVRRAGERLAKAVIWDDADREEIYRTFAIASSWRDSHVYPMRSVRLSLMYRLRKFGIEGLAVSRPKRMSSIRRKLRVQQTMKLDQINDLGGCRVITDTVSGVWKLVNDVTKDFQHPVRGRAYDYVTAGKPDGYRSYHVVFEYAPKGTHDELFSGRRVELQIRTVLQHSWATAVEAVGLFRDENLKGGQGDPGWLRLLKLMSDEFALAERCETGLGSRADRLKEIRDINKQIGALDLLDNMRSATRYVTEYIQAADAKYYLIAYDRATNEVTITPYGDAVVGSLALDKAERELEWAEGRPQKVVLVEIDKIAKLIDAYPNFFGDVLLFKQRLRDLCNPRTEDYILKPQALAPIRRAEKPDMSWMNHPKWRNWGNPKKR